MAEFYDNKVLNESEKELESFIEWCNRFYGYSPIIIGGWAVWAYTKHAKSRDIDIVLPTSQSVHDLLVPYYRAKRFKSTGFLAKEYFREVKTKGGVQKIYLDACSYSNKNILKEKNLEIPWRLLEKNSKEWHFGNHFARIPEPELLLIYKVKALRDREFDSKKTTLTQETLDYLESKIAKDQMDITALLETKINKQKLEKLLKQTKFEKYFNETIKKLGNKS